MGLFKQVKDMKQMVNTATEMIAQAQMLGAQAQALATAQMAAADTARASAVTHAQAEPAPAGADFEPVAGVSLQLFAEISKELAGSAGGRDEAVQVAAGKGVRGENWAAALEAWKVRMGSNPAVASQFNQLYAGV